VYSSEKSAGKNRISALLTSRFIVKVKIQPDGNTVKPLSSVSLTQLRRSGITSQLKGFTDYYLRHYLQINQS
jgi:hypothetical protein